MFKNFQKLATRPKSHFFCEKPRILVLNFLTVHLKIKTNPPPTPWRHLQNLVKTNDVGVRNTCPNALKTLLNCFRDHKYMLCCENAVYKHDFCDNFTTQTVKFPDLSRFWLAMLGFGLPSWKDPRHQSTKVKK